MHELKRGGGEGGTGEGNIAIGLNGANIVIHCPSPQVYAIACNQKYVSESTLFLIAGIDCSSLSPAANVSTEKMTDR